MTRCVDIEFDLSCMELYKEMMCMFLLQMEKETTLGEDVARLREDEGLTFKQRMAIIYRSERKKLISS